MPGDDGGIGDDGSDVACAAGCEDGEDGEDGAASDIWLGFRGDFIVKVGGWRARAQSKACGVPVALSARGNAKVALFWGTFL